MCAVDRAIYTQSAQSQKDCLLVRLPSNGCGDQFVTTQVHTFTHQKLLLLIYFHLDTDLRFDCNIRVCNVVFEIVLNNSFLWLNRTHDTQCIIFNFLVIIPLMSLFTFRMVCVALISSDSLEWEKTQLWALLFKVIRKIIGGVDYKVSNPNTYTA